MKRIKLNTNFCAYLLLSVFVVCFSGYGCGRRFNVAPPSDNTAWTNSKLKIFYLNKNWQLSSINLDGTNPQVLVDTPFPTSKEASGLLSNWLNNLIFSPDSKYISVPLFDKLLLISREKAQVEIIAKGIKDDWWHRWSPDGRFILYHKAISDKPSSRTFEIVEIATKQTKKVADISKDSYEVGWFQRGDLYIVNKTYVGSDMVYEYSRYNPRTGEKSSVGEKNTISKHDYTYVEKERNAFAQAFPQDKKFEYYDEGTASGQAYKFTTQNNFLHFTFSREVRKAPIQNKNKITADSRGKTEIWIESNGKKECVFSDTRFRQYALPLGAWQWVPIFWINDTDYLVFNYPPLTISEIYIIDAAQKKIGKLTDGLFICWSLPKSETVPTENADKKPVSIFEDKEIVSAQLVEKKAKEAEWRKYDEESKCLSAGIILDQQGRTEEAIASFDKGIASNPRAVILGSLFWNKAWIYLRKHDYNQAIACYTKALEVEPQNGSFYADRAHAYFLKKEYDAAWNDVHEAEKISNFIDPAFLERLKTASGREK